MAYIQGVRTKVVTMVEEDSLLLNDDHYEPVIVIPVAQWRRLVEFFNGWVPACECDGRCEACEEDREIKAIFDSVEAPEC
jgi:hypothetical protein